MNETTKVNLLIIDEVGRVLVATNDGYAFEMRSTDLPGAVLFDEAGSLDAISRIKGLNTECGTLKVCSVREFKQQILDSFGSFHVEDMPGMWEAADVSGGETDCAP